MAKPRSTEITIDPPVPGRSGHDATIVIHMVALSSANGSSRLAQAIRGALPDVVVTRARGGFHPTLSVVCEIDEADEIRERIAMLVGEVQP